MVILTTMCNSCIHEALEVGTLKCKAFPNGVPDAIATGSRDHRKPYRGDGGFRFEQNPQREPFPFESWARIVGLAP